MMQRPSGSTVKPRAHVLIYAFFYRLAAHLLRECLINIIGPDGSAFKLIVLSRAPQPIFGSARGLVHIEPDFDEPMHLDP